MSESKFHFPASQIELCQLRRGVLDRIQKSRYQNDRPGPEASDSRLDFHHSHLNGVRKLIPIGLGHLFGAAYSFGPGDQTVIVSQGFALVEIDFAPGRVGSEDSVDAAMNTLSYGRKVTEISISQE